MSKLVFAQSLAQVPDLNALERYCRQELSFGEEARIMSFQPLAGGLESEIFAFDLECGSSADRRYEALVLKLFVGEEAADKTRQEARVLEHLCGISYPVPRLLAAEPAGGPLGRPFLILERISGQQLAHLLREAEGAAQARLLAQFCRLFVQLHASDWRSLAGALQPDDLAGARPLLDAWLVRARELVERSGQLSFLPLVDWVGAQRERLGAGRPALVHGDFHPLNILVRGDGSAVVIDWSGAEVSDPRFDLAWSMVIVGSSWGRTWRDRILGEYERISGGPVEGIEVFETFVTARRVFEALLMLSSGRDRVGAEDRAFHKMREKLPALRSLYRELVARTGVRIPEAEAAFGG